MQHVLRFVGVLFVLWLGLCAWGYAHARTHAYVDVQLQDAGGPQAIGADLPDATLAFADAEGKALGRAERHRNNWRVVHPDPAIGDCTAVEGLPGDGFARCNDALSRATARWVPQVRSARLRIGDCALAPVAVTPEIDGGGIGFWWFPIAHGFGLPSRWASVRLAVDSRQCLAAPAP
jgi:hypothetical protein